MTLARTPKTLAEIDAELVAVHWVWLHAVWKNDRMGEELANCKSNALLEQRFALSRSMALYGS